MLPGFFFFFFFFLNDDIKNIFYYYIYKNAKCKTALSPNKGLSAPHVSVYILEGELKNNNETTELML